MTGKILVNEEVVPNTYRLVLEAPAIARRAKPGQFLMIIPDEVGERVPFTLADWDVDAGTITVYYLEAGVSTMKLRRMKRTWGNCSSKSVIKLNTNLIKAPLPLIDSVIAHELCHLQEMNHGKAFYALLDGLNPDWRQDRMVLRSEGNIYLL